MPSGDPKYGGTNGVDALDFGQPGGALFTAVEASAAMLATLGTPRVSESRVQIPELSAQFQHVGGFAGQTLTLAGWIFADTAVRLDVIEAEIGSYLDGHLRNPNGTVTLELARIKETRLTMPWADGTNIPIWPRTRLVSFDHTTPRKTVVSGVWGVAGGYRLVFERMAS